jgi:hypothetical protein
MYEQARAVGLASDAGGLLQLAELLRKSARVVLVRVPH